MPQLPGDPSADDNTARVRQRMYMESPLAASTRLIGRRRRSRTPDRASRRRVVSLVGTLLLHLVFLFGFVLGSGYDEPLPPPPAQQALQVRLIAAPPPPPPVRGTVPKMRGPRHQGYRHRLASHAVHRTSASHRRAALPLPKPVGRYAVAATMHHAMAEPPLPVTRATAKPASPAPPMPLVPPSIGTPAVTLPKVALQPPMPPPFQLEPARAPQLEGDRPMPPPASLSMPDTPASPPAIDKPAIALSMAFVVPVNPVPVDAAPSAPAAAPAMNTPAKASTPMVDVPAPMDQVRLQPSKAAAIVPVHPALAKIPSPSTPAIPVPTDASAMPATADAEPQKDDVTLAAKPLIASAIQPSISAPAIDVAEPAAAASALPKSATETPSSADTAAQLVSHAEAANTPAPDQFAHQQGVSSAPNATAEGSDDAVVGTPEGMAKSSTSAPPSTPNRSGQSLSHAAGSGSRPGAAAGKSGADRNGATRGAKQGDLGTYVQLQPHGDTRIMNHGRAGISYIPTRFDKDWTPEDESSVDTALRHAVEKTAIKHVFHLPRGIRVECAVHPLLPIALLSCHNPDPPARRMAQKLYDRLNLPGPALAPSAPVASSSAPVVARTPVELDNSAECATARVAGGPLPPGCASTGPVKPIDVAPPASHSWVPASDQFH